MTGSNQQMQRNVLNKILGDEMAECILQEADRLSEQYNPYYYTGGIPTTRDPSTIYSIPNDWTCVYCGRLVPSTIYTCPSCGAPKKGVERLPSLQTTATYRALSKDELTGMTLRPVPGSRHYGIDWLEIVHKIIVGATAVFVIFCLLFGFWYLFVR